MLGRLPGLIATVQPNRLLASSPPFSSLPDGQWSPQQ